MILTDILEKNIQAVPHKTAVVMRPRYRTISLTYQEVYDFSLKIACFLAKKGVKKGDKVLLLAPNSPYWICVFWGSLLGGFVLVPLNLQSTKELVEKVATQTKAKAMIKHLHYQQPISSDLKSFDIEFLREEVRGIDCSNFKKATAKENDLVEILYTSGTTGDPKGVMLTQANLYSNLEAISQLIPISKDDKFLSILPLSHIFEQVAGFLVPFKKRAEVIYAHSSAAIRGLLKEHRITKMAAVPEFLRLFMARIEAGAEEKGRKKLLVKMMNLSGKIGFKPFQRLLFHSVHQQFGGRLQVVASGGAALDPELEKKWEVLGINLLQGYGLTETSPVVSTNTFKNHKVGSVGKVIPGVKAKIASDGEILVKGPNVFQGYFKDKEKTKAAFTPDGWFKTDDLGQMDEDGFLFIKGRKKYLILGPGGQNVYPEDIEFELNKIPGVMDSCVIGLEKASRIEIHAVLLLAKGKTKDPALIIKKANQKLASYQQIASWSIWPKEDFPRSATRKIKKGEVTKYLLAQKEKKPHLKPVRIKTPLVRLLAEITGYSSTQIKNSTQIVRELNLDSLLRIELVARIEEELGVMVDEAAITPTTTVARLEELIKAAKPVPKRQQFKKWPLSWWASFLRRFFQLIFIFPLLKLWVKLKVEGKEVFGNFNLPVVLMPNHISHLDPVVLLMALPAKIRRKVAFAAAADIWYKKRSPITSLGELLLNIFPFPRKRDENIKLGLDYMGRALDEKCSVIVYPEGKISKTGQLQPLKPGAGLIGVEMDCPVIPIKITGLNNILPPNRIIPKRGLVRVKFGQPLRFSRRDSFLQATQKIQRIIREL